jgi:ABC-type xylose transport system permease subunit
VLALFSLSAEVRPYFFTGANFKIILTQTVVVAIGALGMTMIIVSGGIDLSCGSAVAFTSVVGAVTLLKGFSPAVGVAFAILAGGLIGLINGATIAGLRMMPFIVTLGMMGVVRGAAKWLAENQTVNAPESSINQLMGLVEPMQLFPLPPGVWVAIGLAAIMALIMRQTVFGRYVFAIGSNEATARLCGIRVQWQKMLIYALGGLFLRPRRADAIVATYARRPDRGSRVGIGHHRRGGDRRSQPEWRQREHPRLDDRRTHHGGPAKWFQPDGLAELHAGDHHRRRHHPGSRTRSAAAQPLAELSRRIPNCFRSGAS